MTLFGGADNVVLDRRLGILKAAADRAPTYPTRPRSTEVDRTVPPTELDAPRSARRLPWGYAAAVLLCVGGMFLLIGPRPLVSTAAAGVIELTASDDAFVSAAYPAANFGGAGALAVAGSAAPNGEFQTLLKFDGAAAVAAFDSQFGGGRWRLASATLRLTPTNPRNAFFSPPFPGRIAAIWLPRDGWADGAGRPNAPANTGLTWNSLRDLNTPADAVLSVSGSPVHLLAMDAGFVADVSAGGPVTLWLRGEDALASAHFNSSEFAAAANRPTLAVEAVAVPEPAAAALILCGSICGWSVRRRVACRHTVIGSAV